MNRSEERHDLGETQFFPKVSEENPTLGFFQN